MKQIYTFLSLFIVAALMFTGCENATDATEDSSVVLEDAAESIAAAVGDESGGAVESMADVMIAGGGGSLGTAAPVMDGADLVTAGPPVYDSVSGWWTVSVNRTKSNNLVQRSITREYRYKFLRNGVAQKFYNTNGDTATTLKSWIVSGSGYFSGPRVSHELTQLKGAWTVSDINKEIVTITLDSNYIRSGADTILTREMKRTHTSTLTLTAVNLKAPRFKQAQMMTWRNGFAKDISGTISGRYVASITFQNGDLYRERNVDREFTVTVGDGNGSLTIGGNNARFTVDMMNGQRK
ncbi:MAG: hypothetical protein HUU02_03050 [Bacteroidetes bacterium]|nr:hypothetical protein [Bacteroidota bacterium]